MQLSAYKILPRHNYPLLASPELGPWFIRMFRKCWTQIPSATRRTILHYWRNGCMRCPSFELSDMWRDSTKSYGQVTFCGFQVRFSAKMFQLMHEKQELLAHWIVAHELAHVYQWAIGTARVGDEFEVERDADRIARDWGFDNMPFDLLRTLVSVLKLPPETIIRDVQLRP